MSIAASQNLRCRVLGVAKQAGTCAKINLWEVNIDVKRWPRRDGRSPRSRDPALSCLLASRDPPQLSQTAPDYTLSDYTHAKVSSGDRCVPRAVFG